jgi:hypothetical protein
MYEELERRVALRLPFTSEAICVVKTEESVEGEEMTSYGGGIRDLSIEGMFILSSDKPSQGVSCKITISLEGQFSTLEIKDIAGKVERLEGEGFVVNFDNRLEWFALVPIYFRPRSEMEEEEFY